MKLLQLNVVYGVGSTGKIVRDIDHDVRVQGVTSLVGYGRGARVEMQGVYKFCTEAEAAFQKVCNRAGCLMYGGNRLSTHRLIGYIRAEQPDIVHIHCINGYCVNIYRLLAFLADEKVRTVVTHHAEFFYTGSCGHAYDCLRFADMTDGCRHCPTPRAATGAWIARRSACAWTKMRRAFQAFDRRRLMFTAVSQWVAGRSQLSPIVEGFACRVVENGLDTSVFRPMPLPDALRKRLPANGRKSVIHVTASFSDAADTFKGGDKIITLARRMPHVNFIIVSSFSSVTSSLPENITVWGRAASQTELAALYAWADLTVIASRRETFSMIVAESLCCGTPVVGFQAGGPESIAIAEYCDFVAYGDLEALERAAVTMLERRFDGGRMAQQAAARYSRERMVSEYLDVYRELLSR